MRKIISIITASLLIMTVFSGCGVLQKLGFQKYNDEVQPASSVVMNEEDAKKLSDKVPIHLYFANEDNTKLRLEVRYIPVDEAKKSVNTLASTIVKELVKGPSAESGLKATIPAGATLRGPVAISSGVATVDFTKEFVDKHPGGKEAAQMTIYSIVNSLTELKEVQKVKFTVNGKPQNDFKGVFKLDADYVRSTNIISNVPSAPKPSDTPTNSKGVQQKQDDKSKPAETKKPEPVKSPQPTKAPDNKSNPTGASAAKTTNAAPADEADYLEILE